MRDISFPSNRLYSAAQVRELERRVIEQHGIAGIQLMKRAGQAVLDTLLECWPEPELITVYCGSGNNGGDGYIVAALAKARHLPVQVIRVGDHTRLGGDARRACQFALDHGVVIHGFPPATPPGGGIIVDALLGIGLNGEVRGPFAQAIADINASDLPVLAIDVPSGLHSDSGAVCGLAVKADLTVCLMGLKRGLFTAGGAEQGGEIFFDDLAAPVDIYRDMPGVEKLELGNLLAHWPPRSPQAHKGDFGHVLVIGGDRGLGYGYGGAALMAAESAARCGAGLVSVATHAEHVGAILARRPEIMAAAVADHHALLPLLQRATVLVIGPGLGQSPWSEQMLYHSLWHALQHSLPVVLDADALNLLAAGRVVKRLPQQVILTPHPGEAARLLQTTTQQIQQDRFAAAQQLQQQYTAVVVLKGAGTLVASEGALALCAEGNPGMASGGMGDVLSGILGALLAQGLSPRQSAELAVCLHGSAADQLAEQGGQRGLLATDLVPVVRQLLRGCD